MIGDAYSLDTVYGPATTLGRAALRLQRGTRRLWTEAQVRLNLAVIAPRSDIVGAAVIPTVRYRDVPKAVDWLCRAFGMQVHRTVTDADGEPRYAELTVGAGMLMVAPIEDTAFGKLMVQPDEIGGVETQVCYLCVGDARAHAARARVAGAVIIIDPDDEVNRGRGYSCRDLEGHVWNFGVYDPWRTPLPPVPVARWNLGLGLGRMQRALAAAALLALAGTLAMQLLPRPEATAGTAAGTAVASAQALTPAEDGGQAEPPKSGITAAPASLAPVAVKVSTRAVAAAAGMEGTDGDAVETAASVDMAALEATRKAAAEARAQLMETRSALAMAERAATDARAELAELLSAKQAAERVAAEARAKLAVLQKAADRARARAAQERARRFVAMRRAALKRRSAYTGRSRYTTWCYSASGFNRSTGRLSGFCRG